MPHLIYVTSYLVELEHYNYCCLFQSHLSRVKPQRLSCQFCGH